MPGPFVSRHIGVRSADEQTMLAILGHASIESLIDAAVPESIRRRDPLVLPPAASESEVLEELATLADANQVEVSMIGQGFHGCHTPEAIRRNFIENPAWYTAYTSYQPEISQGRLELLLRFQTMVSELTGMDLAGASLLDDATAAAEAMSMSYRLSRGSSKRFMVDSALHPQIIEVVRTRAEPLGIDLVVSEPSPKAVDSCFGILLAHVATTGGVSLHAETVKTARAVGALVCVHTDLLASVLFEPPGAWGADIVVGLAQRFGVPMFAGGPHAGFIATKSEFQRQLPGRIVGVSVDARGRPAYRLSLQTREQHIRRDKATSNICTAQVLLANVAALYACWHGVEGLQRIARRTHQLASSLAQSLLSAEFRLVDSSWFDTITVELRTAEQASAVIGVARSAGINLRRVDETRVGVACDETTTEREIQLVCNAFGVLDVEPTPCVLPVDDPDLARSTPPLSHAVFTKAMSETELLRELRRLADRDLALDRTMIPLGSCTMKLNAAVEMAPVTWPQFANLHPFAPAEQLAGTRELVDQLECMLAEITGYDEVSLQPNAGSQGELAGLLAIRAYHRSRNEEQRDVCLIPTSAHGTNAASAVMAGMHVVPVHCAENGNVDMPDLANRLAELGDRVAALMVTYPSTHGVFEEDIVEICDMVHRAGGQVYIDGANMNALVGLSQPGSFGGDVSHLNLHKTFCIPHGGGGPGVGPVCVRAHLAPFLPRDGHRRPRGTRPVSAAPWGSPGVLMIPWVYLRLMGPDGLRAASATAILSANYVAARLEQHYPVLHRGASGLVAHECILDLRPLTAQTGITVDDVAKRLMDYGFHAPTMSFPVAGTLMVEPTESESLAELDRFCDAMVSIREEAERVATGEWPECDNPLVNAPHTAADLLTDEWHHPYARRVGAFPAGQANGDKYWPPVSRVDGGYGDRNLMCSCPPLEDLAVVGELPLSESEARV